MWDVSNAAIGQAAGIDPAKMTDATWAQIEQRATAVQQAALEIAGMNPIIVVKPGVKIADEGVPGGDTGADVQAGIDKDPQKLRDFANALAVHMGDLATAAKAHDAAKAGPLIDQLDGVCEDCHLEFWYPSQKALLKQYGISALGRRHAATASTGSPAASSSRCSTFFSRSLSATLPPSRSVT